MSTDRTPVPAGETHDFDTCNAPDLSKTASSANASTASTAKPRAKPLFSLGEVVATRAALALLSKHGISPVTALGQHCTGCWGNLTVDDRQANEQAVKDGSRILSVFDCGGTRLYVITEAASDPAGLDRASTCILLPEEY